MTPTILLRWLARVWTIASLVFIGAFAIGSAGTSAFPTASATVGLAFFPIGVVAGLILAWWREAIGGAITLASLAGFYLWMASAHGRLPEGPYFLLVAAPGLLFLANSILERSHSLRMSGRP
jgi:hypothetical protein